MWEASPPYYYASGGRNLTGSQYSAERAWVAGEPETSSAPSGALVRMAGAARATGCAGCEREEREHSRPGRPHAGATPDSAQWQIVATLAINDAVVTRAVRCKAAFLVATNVLDPQELSELDFIQLEEMNG